MHQTFSWLLIDPDTAVPRDLGLLLFHPACDFPSVPILSQTVVTDLNSDLMAHRTMIFMITFTFVEITDPTETVIEVTWSDIVRWFFHLGNTVK